MLGGDKLVIIGCVKEIKTHEYRVGLTPDNVHAYVAAGHRVLVERDAGAGCGFTAQDYRAAGAAVCDGAGEIWEQAEMIVKVKEPLPEEYRYFRPGLILYTYLHLAADRALLDALLTAGVRGVAYETLMEAGGALPLLAPMSVIAGRLSVQEGAKYLEKPFGGAGVLLAGMPGVPRAQVLILGGGMVGSSAAQIAVGMGAQVSILDLNLERLAALDTQYGNRVQTLYNSGAALERALPQADLVIGAVLIPGKSAPKLVRREHLANMKPGSVIVDVAVDQGGCCETTHVTYHNDPVYTVDGVLHYCVGTMPGAVPRTSTLALTNATLRYGLAIAGAGLPAACARNEALYSAVNTWDGVCTCRNVADSFGIPWRPATAAVSGAAVLS